MSPSIPRIPGRLAGTQRGLRRPLLSLLAAALGLSLALAPGCSAPNPYRGEQFRSLLEKPSLPYVVRLKGVRLRTPAAGGDNTAGDSTAGDRAVGEALDPATGDQPVEDDSGEIRARPRDIVGGVARDEIGATESQRPAEPSAAFLLTAPEREAAVLAKVREALEKHGVFTFVSSDPQDFERLGIEPQLELTVDIDYFESPRGFDHKTNNFKWVNLGLWLFAGLPGWIIEDVEVEPGVRDISLGLRRLDDADRKEVMNTGLDLSGVNKLNFLRRAGWLEYLTQIVVPPFLVGSDQETANESLYENYVSRLQSAIPGSLKNNLARELGAKFEAQLITVTHTDDSLDLLIFSNRDISRVKVDLVEAGSSIEFVPEQEPDFLDDWGEKTASLLSRFDYLRNYEYKYGVTASGLAEKTPAPRPGPRFLVVRAQFPTSTGFEDSSWTLLHPLSAPGRETAGRAAATREGN